MAGADSDGGSLILSELFDQFGESIERDLLFYYGLDVFDLWDNGSRLTPARTLRLLRNLPDDSHTKAMHSGGAEHIGWSRETAILADLFDAIQVNTHALVMSNTDSKSRNKVEEPKFYPRPGAEQGKRSRKRESNSFAAIAYARLQGNRGGDAG